MKHRLPKQLPKHLPKYLAEEAQTPNPAPASPGVLS